MNARRKILLLTGGRGFIGRAALHEIVKTQYFSEIHAVRSASPGALPPFNSVIWHSTNLLESGRGEDQRRLAVIAHAKRDLLAVVGIEDAAAAPADKKVAAEAKAAGSESQKATAESKKMSRSSPSMPTLCRSARAAWRTIPCSRPWDVVDGRCC